jgi:hypothetical protein
MHNVGLVVEQLPDAVADKVAHDARPLGFGVRLDGGSDVAGGIARPRDPPRALPKPDAPDYL